MGDEYANRFFSVDEETVIHSTLNDIETIGYEPVEDDETQVDYDEFFTNVESPSFEENYDYKAPSSLDETNNPMGDLSINNLISENEDQESELEIRNKSIKLDIWLKNCFKDSFYENFLRYKSIKDFDDKEDQIHQIVSYFELEEILLYKYKRNFDEFFDLLNEMLIGYPVLDLVNIAKNYDVEIALNKKDLLLNFLEKFHPYEVLSIFGENNIDYQKVFKISVLEQIYILSDSKLDEFSKKLCSEIAESKYSKISCIVNNFEEGFLISNNNLDRGQTYES